jgi:hypothetical protein
MRAVSLHKYVSKIDLRTVELICFALDEHNKKTVSSLFPVV